MIKNEYTVTWKLYREWLWENKLKGTKLVFLIFWSLMTIATLLLSYLSSLSAFYILMTLYCIYQAFIRDYVAAKRQYNQLAKFCGGENWTRTITISEEEICISEGPSVTNLKNTDVIRIATKEDKIWLTLNNNTVIRMYQSAFVEGNLDTCREFFTPTPNQ